MARVLSKSPFPTHIPMASVPASASRTTTGLEVRTNRDSKSSALSSVHSSLVNASTTSTGPPRRAAQSAASSTSGCTSTRGLPTSFQALAVPWLCARRLGTTTRAKLQSATASRRTSSLKPQHRQRSALEGALARVVKRGVRVMLLDSRPPKVRALE